MQAYGCLGQMGLASIFSEMVAARAALSWEQAEAMAMAVLASTNLMRISEAVSEPRTEKGVVEFYGVKNEVGWHAQPVGSCQFVAGVPPQ